MTILLADATKTEDTPSSRASERATAVTVQFVDEESDELDEPPPIVSADGQSLHVVTAVDAYGNLPQQPKNEYEDVETALD